MNKEKDFFKTCFNTVARLEVKNESQAIAKEVVLSEVKNLEQENKKLKDNWNKLKEFIVESNKTLCWTNNYDSILGKMEELQGSDNNDTNR